MQTGTLRTAPGYLEEAKRILDHQPFNREAEARVDALLKLFWATRASSEYQLGKLGERAAREVAAAALDPATLAFFRGLRPDRAQMSESGGRVEQVQAPRFRDGRSAGEMAVLRDCSALTPERRGLTTDPTGGDAGTTIPIGFIPTVLAAMKQTDQVLWAANWDIAATADGRQTDLPSLTDTTTSALVVTEGGPMTFANPGAFGQLQFPTATTWSSQVIKASIQLDEDAGVKLAVLLGDAFRVRFARGFGASVVTYLLADTPVGATTAASAAITQADLLSLVGSVDPAYGAAPTAGWAMSWTTLLYIFQNIITTASGGDALYHARQDANGHYLLLGKPVFISPSLPNIGASNTPVLYGDWNRLIIRSVPSEAVVRRYDELYMPTFQVGYEMLFRADPLVMHAGGSGDNPIMALRCSSS